MNQSFQGNFFSLQFPLLCGKRRAKMEQWRTLKKKNSKTKSQKETREKRSLFLTAIFPRAICNSLLLFWISLRIHVKITRSILLLSFYKSSSLRLSLQNNSFPSPLCLNASVRLPNYMKLGFREINANWKKKIFMWKSRVYFNLAFFLGPQKNVIFHPQPKFWIVS